MRHISITVAYLTRQLQVSTKMLMALASVINLYKGSVFFGTAPTAKMQRGRR
jgi:hypothetical protein